MAPINNDNTCPVLPRYSKDRKRYNGALNLENYRREFTVELRPSETSLKVGALVRPKNRFLPLVQPFKSLGLKPEKNKILERFSRIFI